MKSPKNSVRIMPAQRHFNFFLKPFVSTQELWVTQEGRRVLNPVLVISYETFRAYSEILNKKEVGMVICDEVSQSYQSRRKKYVFAYLYLTRQNICIHILY